MALSHLKLQEQRQEICGLEHAAKRGYISIEVVALRSKSLKENV
jgi:hypothetical protein